jgi:hypothetical protein
MAQPPPQPPRMETSDLTGAVKTLAERIEPRLTAGNERFAHMGKMVDAGKYLAAALVPLIVVTFGFTMWSVSLAKKSDVSAQAEAEAARHVDLERRVTILEVERAADAAANTKANATSEAQWREQSDKMLDMRIRMGAVPVAPMPAPKRAR